MRVTIATDAETRARLKRVAAIRGQTMEGALRQIVEVALKEARTTERLRELQAQDGPLAAL